MIRQHFSIRKSLALYRLLTAEVLLSVLLPLSGFCVCGDYCENEAACCEHCQPVECADCSFCSFAEPDTGLTQPVLGLEKADFYRITVPSPVIAAGSGADSRILFTDCFTIGLNRTLLVRLQI